MKPIGPWPPQGEELHRLEGLPLLQNRLWPDRSSARQAPTGNIRLIRDRRTGLVVNAAFEPERVSYDRFYNNEQSHSPRFLAHLDDVVALIERHLLPVVGGGRLLEIGCGKGVFLHRLRAEGIDAWGVDPTYEGDDPFVIKDFFSPALGLAAGGLILRHVLEHIPNPWDFLLSLRDCFGDVPILIEVPCFDWILARKAWFDVFYEHVNYFRLRDFERMFARLLAAQHCFGGQYLCVVASLGSLRPPQDDANPAPCLRGLADGPRTLIERLAGRPALLWGGASKGVVVGLSLDRHGHRPLCAVDIDPAKQGKYMPVSAIPVLSPDAVESLLELDPTILVMNGNYLEEVRRMLPSSADCRTID